MRKSIPSWKQRFNGQYMVPSANLSGLSRAWRNSINMFGLGEKPIE